MNKKIYAEVFERAGGTYCELCGSNNEVQLHHIVKGSGKRKVCERTESVIFLCWAHHYGKFGIHGMEGKALDLKLKLYLQDIYKQQGMNEDTIRKWMGGKIYG